MAVFRVHRSDNYTVMSNHHLRNKDLSLSAKGLLSVILSLPPEWNYSIHGLSLISKEGDKAIKSALDELKEHRYLIVRRINPHQGSNRVRYEYDVYEEPANQRIPTKAQVAEAYPSEGVQAEGVLWEGVPEGGQLSTEGLSTDKSSTDLYMPSKPRKKKAFVPPTLDDVRSYVREKGYHFSAEDFVAYYSASDWHFASGKPVKSWKQCCVTWEQNHRPCASQIDTSQYDIDDWHEVERRG